jgi:hypothetical protein
LARLFPKIDPSEIENPGERKVAKALVGQLPSRVEIFHSFHWMGDGRKGTVVEGECDFVVLDPENGLLFVEVKGGSLDFDPERMEWHRTTPLGEKRLLGKDPFEQVRKSMHEIVDRIVAVMPGAKRPLPFTYGFAVAFPDCRYTGSLPPSIVPDQLLDAAKCSAMSDSFERVFNRFRLSQHGTLSSQDVQSVHDALFPRYAIVPVVWRKVEDQEARLHRLTHEQQRLLEFLGDHTLAAIKGVAGSGKTILALAKAQESARKGFRTLFLCYNRPLKDWVLQMLPESSSDGLVVDTYHGLVADLCWKAEVPFRAIDGDGNADFWRDLAPEKLIEACSVLGDELKFDAVVVDEGQDFHDLWWTSLEDVFRNPSNKACYYVFFDPNQNLYVNSPSIPGELGPPFQLPVNCRNTVRIAEHCASLVKQPNKVKDGAPMGDAPEFLSAPNVREAFQLAGKRVREWCMPGAGGLKSSQVAVLVPSGSDRDWSVIFKTVPATSDFEKWRSDKGVLIAPWRRFKGLEADAIVIVESAPESEELSERANRYVARSRAKHLLTVVQVDS